MNDRDYKADTFGKSSSEWAAQNPYLAKNDLGIETDTGRIKMGIGLTWSATPYVPSEGPVQSINGATGVVALNLVTIGGGEIGNTGITVGWSDSSPAFGLSLIDTVTETQAVFGVLDTIMPGSVSMTGLPTSDPAVAGRLWNDGGTLKVSAGAP